MMKPMTCCTAPAPFQFRDRDEQRCPYFDSAAVCRASLGLREPSPYARVSFCSKEDFDNCPLFLSKILRMR